jgi:ribonuclease-3
MILLLLISFSLFVIQKMVEFEEAIGIQFTHIRLLAKAFSMRSVGYNNLTM